ncbi:hypothetical protein U1Q18_004957 [Sarracenia purpurea var. burkii]
MLRISPAEKLRTVPAVDLKFKILKMMEMEMVMMMRRRMVMVVVTLGVMAANVKKSDELKSSHPLHGVVDRINGNGGPYIGLVMADPNEESVLVASGLFLPSPHHPWVDLSGTLSLSLSLSF